MPKPAFQVPLIFHPSTFIHKPFLLTFRGSQLPLELLIMTGSLSIPKEFLINRDFRRKKEGGYSKELNKQANKIQFLLFDQPLLRHLRWWWEASPSCQSYPFCSFHTPIMRSCSSAWLWTGKTERVWAGISSWSKSNCMEEEVADEKNRKEIGL